MDRVHVFPVPMSAVQKEISLAIIKTYQSTILSFFDHKKPRNEWTEERLLCMLDELKRVVAHPWLIADGDISTLISDARAPEELVKLSGTLQAMVMLCERCDKMKLTVGIVGEAPTMLRIAERVLRYYGFSVFYCSNGWNLDEPSSERTNFYLLPERYDKFDRAVLSPFDLFIMLDNSADIRSKYIQDLRGQLRDPTLRPAYARAIRLVALNTAQHLDWDVRVNLSLAEKVGSTVARKNIMGAIPGELEPWYKGEKHLIDRFLEYPDGPLPFDNPDLGGIEERAGAEKALFLDHNDLYKVLFTLPPISLETHAKYGSSSDEGDTSEEQSSDEDEDTAEQLRGNKPRSQSSTESQDSDHKRDPSPGTSPESSSHVDEKGSLNGVEAQPTEAEDPSKRLMPVQAYTYEAKAQRIKDRVQLEPNNPFQIVDEQLEDAIAIDELARKVTEAASLDKIDFEGPGYAENAEDALDRVLDAKVNGFSLEPKNTSDSDDGKDEDSEDIKNSDDSARSVKPRRRGMRKGCRAKPKYVTEASDDSEKRTNNELELVDTRRSLNLNLILSLNDYLYRIRLLKSEIANHREIAQERLHVAEEDMERVMLLKTLARESGLSATENEKRLEELKESNEELEQKLATNPDWAALLSDAGMSDAGMSDAGMSGAEGFDLVRAVEELVNAENTTKKLENDVKSETSRLNYAKAAYSASRDLVADTKTELENIMANVSLLESYAESQRRFSLPEGTTKGQRLHERIVAKERELEKLTVSKEEMQASVEAQLEKERGPYRTRGRGRGGRRFYD